MTKIKKLIERNYQKKLKYAEQKLLERDYNSAEKLFLSCYNHYKAENNSLMISRILLLLSDIYIEIGNSSNAYNILRKEIEFYRKRGSPVLLACIYNDLGIILRKMGKYNESLEFFKNAEKILEKEDKIETIIKIKANIAINLYLEGSLEEAIEYGLDAEELSLNNGIEGDLGSIYNTLSDIYYLLNDITQFEEYFNKAKDWFEKNENFEKLAIFYINMNSFYYYKNDQERQEETLKNALEISEDYDIKYSQLYALVNLSLFFIDREDYNQALNYLKKAKEMLESYEDIILKGRFYFTFGIYYLRKESSNKSQKYLKKALDISKDSKDKFTIIKSYLGLGENSKINGNYNNAYRYFSRALETCRTITENLNLKSHIEVFKRSYEDVIKTIAELNSILESEEFDKSEIDRNELIVNCKNIDDIKGPLLEDEAKKLYIKLGFNDINLIKKSEKRINEEQIEFLVNEKCYKEKNQTVEIDLLGSKKNDRNIYLFGECKNRGKKITIKDIKCFIIKADIIAKNYLDRDKFDIVEKPKFKLVIISLKGFPEEDKVKEVFNKYWTLSKSSVIGNLIELIDEREYNRLIQDHLGYKSNISVLNETRNNLKRYIAN